MLIGIQKEEGSSQMNITERHPMPLRRAGGEKTAVDIRQKNTVGPQNCQSNSVKIVAEYPAGRPDGGGFKILDSPIQS
jgi:hypothetical protein